MLLASCLKDPSELWHVSWHSHVMFLPTQECTKESDNPTLLVLVDADGRLCAPGTWLSMFLNPKTTYYLSSSVSTTAAEGRANTCELACLLSS